MTFGKAGRELVLFEGVAKNVVISPGYRIGWRMDLGYKKGVFTHLQVINKMICRTMPSA